MSDFTPTSSEEQGGGALLVVRPRQTPKAENVAPSGEAGRDQGLKPGMALKNGVVILRKLDVASGEADLYLCEYQGRQLVLKHYRSVQSLKKEVIQTIKSIRSECVATVYSVGTLLGRSYEIDAYYPLGSLDGKKVPAETLRRKIIPQLNEGLHTLHTKGLLHKDLKPSNIMLRSEQYDIALIDFGVSSLLEGENTALYTQTGVTFEFSAPETKLGWFWEESDYYSMGITLYALYLGRSPFAGMDAEEISRYTAIQRLPMPEDMPADLQELILGLTYVDLTNRGDKSNPNRRWTYEEVRKWLAGEKQRVPGNPNTAFLPNSAAVFDGERFTDQPALTEAMIAKWEYGKGQLNSGELARMFRRCAPESAPLCAAAQEKAKEAGGSDDLAYFFLLYELLEQKERFVWKGRSYESAVALGSDMLSRLQSGAEPEPAFYGSMLKHKALSAYARLNALDEGPLMAAIRAAEEAAAQPATSKDATKRLHYRLAYLLSGQKKLVIDGKSYFTLEELSAQMQLEADRSFEGFRLFAHRLMPDERTLDPQFEAWMEALGHAGTLEAWREQLAT